MDNRTTMNGKPVFTVPSKTVINFESGFKEKLLCDGPTFTAGTACPYSCSFCYVPAAMKKQEPWLQKHGVTGKHEDIVIRRENPAETARKQLMSKSEEYRTQKLTIYASPLTDVAANMELVRETVAICKVILELTNWDIRLLSKSNLLPQVAKALEVWAHSLQTHSAVTSARSRIIYGVSTGTLDDKLAAAFEAGTPKVSKRIESLHWLQDNGFRTFGMICPSLPQTSYHQFAHDMAQAIRSDRCEHVWAEVINLRGDSFLRTFDELLRARFHNEANRLSHVSHDNLAWRFYARATFEAHAGIGANKGKLRFLQYVTSADKEYWTNQVSRGAVLL